MIIDAPPVLPVTDGIIVARQAAMNIVVARSGEHTVRQFDAAVARYRQNGITAGRVRIQLSAGQGGVRV